MDFAGVARYIFMGLIAIFTLVAFVGSTTTDKRGLRGIYAVQNVITFVIHLIGYLVLYMGANDMK